MTFQRFLHAGIPCFLLNFDTDFQRNVIDIEDIIIKT